ncbi:MAG: right-handed parallel beta-helix repeat-containing protein [Pirellulaceae bacterium]|nr:right-handed parallel beta-helix repeat-containing protein [Pirellulaceae bacterium]
MSKFALIALTLALAPSLAAAEEFHASSTGTAQGNGSREQPWDLATALLAKDRVQPGDTLWLHEGTYVGGFTSYLAGTTVQPIVVRGEAHKRVIIDARPRDARDNALFAIEGNDVIFRDFEMTCTDPVRETKIAGSWPEDIRRGNFHVKGSRISLVNLVVHDLASGFGFWAEGEEGEISGCLIYNNGWQGPDRAHGHAIYAQNAKGTKKLKDNIIFHQFGYGIHVYGSEKASLKGFEIDGNICFENGALSKNGDRSQGIMVGGASPAERIAIRDNVVFGGGIRLGYPWGTTSEDVVCTGNYCEGLVIRDFRKAIVSRNTIVAHSSAVILEGEAKLLLSGHQWSENDFYITDGRWGDFAIVENGKSRGLTFEQWRQETDLAGKSTFTKGAPTKLRVVVRPNSHEPGRANIAVLNPAGLEEVELDLTSILKPGQQFRIVSAKDFYGPVLITGTYDGQPIRLPMKPVTPPPPVGLPNAKLPVTEPKFAAFVVLPRLLFRLLFHLLS